MSSTMFLPAARSRLNALQSSWAGSVHGWCCRSEADEEGSVAESTASLGHDDDDEVDPAPAHLKGVA